MNGSLVKNRQILLDKLHPVDLMSYLELEFYLQSQLLKDTDFMSMYHSIEVRVPYLDHKLVEYLSGLNPALKLGKEINKPLIVNGVRDLVPEEILNRKKMGFTFPFEKWFSELKIANSKEHSVKQSAISDLRFARRHWSRFWAREVLNRWQ